MTFLGTERNDENEDDNEGFRKVDEKGRNFFAGEMDQRWRTLLQGRDCDMLGLGLKGGDSTPSVFFRKFLSWK